MQSLERRLSGLERCVSASRLQVIVVRKGETTEQARRRMGNPSFVVIVPEKDAPDQTDGV